MADEEKYTVRMLKRAAMLNLTEAARDSHLIAWANRTSPRRLRALPSADFLRMRMEYTASTTPTFYRKRDDGMRHWGIYECYCDCVCGECIGLERSCDECQCEEPVFIARIPRELTAGHLIDGGDDAIRLIEVIIGKDCDSMTMSHFRTMNMVVMSELRTGEIPLPDDTTAST